MCGIVGGITQRNITPILIEGLNRLEYRGYDSAGLAVISQAPGGEYLQRVRAVGKVAELEAKLEQEPTQGRIGIAHTRWATHGVPSEINAHPHLSRGQVAVVHNGIIENYAELKQQLIEQGYGFCSQTDTEVIAHLLEQQLSQGLTPEAAFIATLAQLEGAYALGVIFVQQPDRLYAARQGSPLVLGQGSDEYFIGSDPLALLQVTDRFVYLEEGDYLCLQADQVQIWNAQGELCDATARPVVRYEHGPQAATLGEYRHYMAKEMHEQPAVIAATLEGKISPSGQLLTAILGPEAEALLDQIQQIHLVACGTSYHAAMVARYWIESLAKIQCSVEVASEYRYRDVVVPRQTLFLCLSQSGETADTLAALRHAKQAGYLATLAICNVPGSSLVREAQLRLMTHAGPEIGVASTKAFTTQLTALLWLAGVLAQARSLALPDDFVTQLQALPQATQAALALEQDIAQLAEHFATKHHALFLGRGAMYPVAMEGALKLKEISYIHAEAYAAGELKHGPLALVDEDMPVITVAPSNSLLEKLKSNLQEVKARGGQLINFACLQAGLAQEPAWHHLPLPKVSDLIAPIVYSIPLQLLAYHVALVKGTDVDKPRNLAKSVTVE